MVDISKGCGPAIRALFNKRIINYGDSTVVVYTSCVVKVSFLGEPSDAGRLILSTGERDRQTVVLADISR